MKLLPSGTETSGFMLRENDWGLEITHISVLDFLMLAPVVPIGALH
jgi:hypothetical protein